MNKFRATALCLIASIYITFFLARSAPVQAVSPSIMTDQAIYSIWGTGGPVKVTAQNLTPNTTYYLWIGKPRQTESNFTGLSFPRVASVGTQSQIVLKLSPHDPAGTYMLSLSNSSTLDRGEARAHFGVFGTNSHHYQRTDTVLIAGGGVTANSTLSLTINSPEGLIAGFPLNLTAHGNGDFQFEFKLSPSSATGNLSASITGTSFDKHQAENMRSSFIVMAANITAKALNSLAPTLQRTVQANATYHLSYPDGSPVTAANLTAEINAGTQRAYSVPLTLVNATSGEWRATWTPSASAPNATYHFQFNPANFTDAYGNKGQGASITSTGFTVIPAMLHLTVQGTQIVQRTLNSTFRISATYPNGANVMNVTQATLTVIRNDNSTVNISPSEIGPQTLASFKIPVNAPLGNWTVNYAIRDLWNNSASGKFIFHVQQAALNFQTQIPATTQRTTSLNLTNTVYYPDGTTLNSTVTLQVFAINQTWTPTLTYDPASGRWSGSVYIVQNATLGEYNLTWSAQDPYGNTRASNYTTLIVPASFNFLVRATNATVLATSNLDLPVVVNYPNGTSLTSDFGNVTGSYQNTTGYVFTYPLAYNATNGTWHMIFFVPEQSNATLSFTATDHFGNTATAMDLYNLKIAPVPRVATQNLIIAGIIGALIPVGLLIWAFATISTRRRKHKP